jgi:hypothetical protein
MMTMIAITAFDRLGLGVLAALLALVSIRLLDVPPSASGRLWRRLIRPKRQHLMNIMIWRHAVDLAGDSFAVPSRGFEVEESGAEQRFSTLSQVTESRLGSSSAEPMCSAFNHLGRPRLRGRATPSSALSASSQRCRRSP